MANLVIADDDELNRDILLTMLTKLGYKDIAVCCDGTEAWDYISNHAAEIQVVLLDKMMPGLNGMEIFQNIKDNENCAHIIALLQSADAYDKHIEESLKAGIFAYVTKPFDVSELDQCLKDAFASFE